MSTATLQNTESGTRYDVAMANTNILGYQELADLLGVGMTSIHTYHARASHHRKLAAETGDPKHVRPGDLPEPDGRIGRSPYWEKKTIDRWMKQRPGRGGYNKETAKRNAARAKQAAKN